MGLLWENERIMTDTLNSEFILTAKPHLIIILLFVFDPAHSIITQIFLNASCDAKQALTGCANTWDQMTGTRAPEEGQQHFNLRKVRGQDKTESPRRKLEKGRFFPILREKKNLILGGRNDKQDEWTSKIEASGLYKWIHIVCFLLTSYYLQ